MVSVWKLFASFAVAGFAAPSCRPPATLTLPKVGGGTELPPPPPTLTLKKIALGHGIQNYTCESTTGEAKATGALAVLYDVTSLHPSATGRNTLSPIVWNKLPSTLLWTNPLPLNPLPTVHFGADPANPFPEPSSLRLHSLPEIKFLGHHFFDAQSTPTFDLKIANLKASVAKTGAVDAPRNADKGILGTGAVSWLELGDNGKGLSQGVSKVYRVITAGGVAQKCEVAGAGAQSVPYTTYYWFYG